MVRPISVYRLAEKRTSVPWVEVALRRRKPSPTARSLAAPELLARVQRDRRELASSAMPRASLRKRWVLALARERAVKLAPANNFLAHQNKIGAVDCLYH